MQPPSPVAIDLTGWKEKKTVISEYLHDPTLFFVVLYQKSEPHLHK